MQIDTNINPTGLGLCSMRSTVSELFVAPSARFRLVSLANKHRHVYKPYRLKSASLQAYSYQKAAVKSLPVNLAAEYHRHSWGLSSGKDQHFAEGPMFANDAKHSKKSYKGSGPTSSWAIEAFLR